MLQRPRDHSNQLLSLRRTYTQSHVDYVIEVVQFVASQAQSLGGYRIVAEPAQLRHFTARFEPLPA